MKQKKIQQQPKIVAVDIGTKNTGLVIGPENFFVTTIKAEDGCIAERRLISIASQVAELSKDADYVVIEDYAMGRVFNTEVAELMGIMKFLLSKSFSGKIGLLNSSMIRSILCGNGRSSEKEIKEAVKEVYGDVYKTIHEVDALAIYYVFNKYLNEELDDERMRKIRGRVYEL